MRRMMTAVVAVGLTALVLGGCPPSFSELCTGEACGFTSDAGGDARPAVDGDANTDPPLVTRTDKVDLLLAVDNSRGMGDKQVLLSEVVPDLIARLLTPTCVDSAGNPIMSSDGSPLRTGADGKCPGGQGRPEFNPVQDLHVAMVSSSVGSSGAPICDPKADGNQGYHVDDRGHLLARVATGIPNAAPSNFLTWLPDTQENRDKGKLPTKDGTTPEPSEDKLRQDFQAMVAGINERGCSYEGQLESVYRFLVQPDPYEAVTLPGNGSDPSATVSLRGVDAEILRQRADFLREDSLVAVVMLTDENESTVDPLALGGHAWLYEGLNAVSGGTPACESNPMDSSCFSCSQDGARGLPCYGQTLEPEKDQLTVRFYEPKRRFGIDPRFPIDRYTTGFTQTHVPDRRGEHPDNSFSYVGNATCTNPLFARALPRSGAVGTKEDADKLCNLPRGPRSPQLVFFALIGGVPWQLLTDRPTDLSEINSGTFKTALDASDWDRILGADPLRYDFNRIDPHMRESIVPRSGVSSGEWETDGRDLQYACTFPLPAPRDCSLAANERSCGDCKPDSKSPLCDPNNKTMQLRAKAYPSVSQLAVAKALGNQSAVSSICPRSLAKTLQDNTPNPNYGYRPAVRAIVDRVRPYLLGGAPDAGP